MRGGSEEAGQGREGGDTGGGIGGEEEELQCQHGGGHQETGDALPAAAEVWKGTNN